jgi:hypothetical protein
MPPMTTINQFCTANNLSIASNPCVSRDFCLDWAKLAGQIKRKEGITLHHASRFKTTAGDWALVENAEGDCAWILAHGGGDHATLSDGVELTTDLRAYPATWQNLLTLKNLIQDSDPDSTIFPSAAGSLKQSSLGVGARFTTLHWPAVEWAMAQLKLSMTANQNSIPRELVYDVDAMLANKLETVPFPFIGGNVPEGHQGQSVEGMSHGAVLSKLKTGFHQRRIAWGFNADHQPIGGKFDVREDQLVAGCLLATYITFDLSPELSQTKPPESDQAAADYCRAQIPADLVASVKAMVAAAGLTCDENAFNRLLCAVWPAINKMKRRDEKYARARAQAFTTQIGRAYFRELSIDELPGLTTPETLATMLGLCSALGMPVQFVAPAFGFQKNFPFDDGAELERRVSAAWQVCKHFGVSIGFHSGSGKSAENYQLCGRITGGNLEIKTSGRYTYEMGVALCASTDNHDRALWRDWYSFTRDLAIQCAFGEQETERSMARQFIVHALKREHRSVEVFASAEACHEALKDLKPNPDHMFWFEYNFLFVLAADGAARKSALGDHTPAGYRQRARFYAISQEGRLRYAQNVARYLCFLAETTGLASADKVAAAKAKIERYRSYDEFLGAIAPSAAAQSASQER